MLLRRVTAAVWLVAAFCGAGWAEDGVATATAAAPRVVGAAEAELVARLAEVDGKLSSQLLTNDTGGPQEGDGAGLCALLGQVGELSVAVEQERVRAAKRPRYYANRAAYDAGARHARERAVAAAADLEARGKSAAALAVYGAFYDAYPECPGSREIALKVATLARSAVRGVGPRTLLLRGRNGGDGDRHCLAALELPRTEFPADPPPWHEQQGAVDGRSTQCPRRQAARRLSCRSAIVCGIPSQKSLRPGDELRGRASSLRCG
jgi:hypothetical protein